jgi:hypothetical protein
MEVALMADHDKDQGEKMCCDGRTHAEHVAEAGHCCTDDDKSKDTEQAGQTG